MKCYDNMFNNGHSHISEEIQIEIGAFIQVFGILSYFLSNLGNLLLLGIAHYEKFGQDPQKRSLPDRVLSFNIILAVVISVIHSNIIIVRI